MNEPPLIIGVESEYAIAPRNPVEFGSAAQALLQLGCLHTNRSAHLISRVKSRHPHLIGARNGVFLRNEARVYDDLGHPEYATPEASDPLEATAHVLAGRSLLKDALSACDPGEFGQPDIAGLSKNAGWPLALFDLNIDYGEHGCAGWGCHENYAFTGPADAVRQAILPHLCSRVILSGAGGFNPYRPLQFVISPRGFMMRSAMDRIRHDSLFHIRQEPYAGCEIDRLHIVAGESLRSHRGIFLKLGTTALLVWLAQCGSDINLSYRPKSAFVALQTFSEDLTGFARVCCLGGDSRSALEIQRALLELAEGAIRTRSPGDWAAPLVDLWRESLNQFALQGQIGLQQTFDWAIKWAVFDGYCQTHGMSFQQLLEWDEVLARFGRISKHFGASLSRPKHACEIAASELKSSWPAYGGHSRDKLEPVLRLRLALRELDWRFCQVGDGVFDELDRQEVLRHDVPGLTRQMISDAMNIAPRKTRAWVRSEMINRWHGAKHARNARCDWRFVSDPDHNRMLEMNDPTSIVKKWCPLESSEEFSSDPFDQAIELYRVSRFLEASALLGRLRRSVNWNAVDSTAIDTFPFRLLRYSAWVLSRLGRFDGIEFLSQAYGRQTRPEAECYRIGDYLYCQRFLGLVPHPMMEPLIKPATEFLSTPASSSESLQANIREHLGAYALASGSLDRVEPLIGEARRETVVWRRVRIHCILADANRRLGRPSRAQAYLESAGEGINPRDVLTAEQILPMRAKLEPSPQRRAIFLDLATRRLHSARHHMALARVLLLRARNCGGGEISQSLRREFTRSRRAAHVLAECPLAVRIVKNWQQWTESFEPDETGDVYWGL